MPDHIFLHYLDQARRTTGSEKNPQAHAEDICSKLQAEGFRAHSDARNEKMGKRIRENELQKVPVMLIIGDRDVENGTVSIRHRGEGDLGAKSLEEAIAYFRELEKR